MSDKELRDFTQMIATRNTLLHRYFKHHLPNDLIRLSGSPHMPVVVVNDSHVVRCYVKNFKLFHTDGRQKGAIIFEHKLSEQTPEDFGDVEQFKIWYRAFPPKKCFRLKSEYGNLYYSGYEITDEEAFGVKAMYPRLSEYEPKIFYTKKFAETTKRDLESQEVPLNIKFSVV